MIDEEDDSYILSKCTQHGDKSRFYNVALKNLISQMRLSDSGGKKNAKKSKPKRAKGSTNSDSGRSTRKRGK
jgi:hypothetical protein